MAEKPSKAQERMLSRARYSALSNSFYLTPSDGIRRSSLESMERKGLVEGMGSKWRYWLTPEGEKYRKGKD